MEGIVEIDKEKYFDNCRKIVVEMLTDEELSEAQFDQLTNEIMDLCLYYGGDFADDNIKYIVEDYNKRDGIK
jgi:hypothetical protein